MADSTELFDGDLKSDLSPMIDLVFLLLVFFLVTANIITYPKDPRVVIPIASDAKVPELVEGRVVLNVLNDGTIVDTAKNVLSLEQVTRLVAQAKAKNPNTRLHLRGDARVAYKHLKDVSRASSEGGVPTVIFSTYVTGK